ncbi:ABC transporter substrate-binding protein [Rhodococcus erythropolis]|uniref:ABC transporter substrate-binding protein n=1 Tax=Rhodococcus erythropolis TaxID=1833 RepID=UPI0008790A5C|nr:ABC transporter substrate-binding protein [Rhodococcus erythropolis]OFV73852.1 NMT1/THI5 like protein [Rhodococcus erythropolis]
MTFRRNTKLAVGAVIAASAMITACSSGSENTELDADSDGLKAVRVTTLGLCNEAIVWGIDQGIFADHGLNIELVNVQSGAAGIAAMQSGDTDVAFVNTLSAMQAVQEGVPMQVVSGSGLSTAEANAVVVAADSPINSPKGLQGQKIGINQLGGLGQVVTQAWIEQDAGSEATAEFVTLPFADQIQAVQNGTVAAAQVTAIQARSGEESGATRSLGNPFFEVAGPLDTAVYLGNADFVAANTEVMTDFAEAMTATADSANDPANDAARFPVMAASCKSTPEVVAATPEPVYEGQLDMDALNAVVALLEAQDQISDVDVNTLVPEFARGN